MDRQQETKEFIQNVQELISIGRIKNYSAFVKEIGWNLGVMSEVMNGKKNVPAYVAAKIREMMRERSISQPFTEQEEKVMQLLVTAHNEYCKLDLINEMDQQEWTRAIHQLQHILIYRNAKRMYPGYFR